MKVIHVGAESVQQNCVMRRCGNLHIHILLQVVLYFEDIEVLLPLIQLISLLYR